MRCFSQPDPSSRRIAKCVVGFSKPPAALTLSLWGALLAGAAFGLAVGRGQDSKGPDAPKNGTNVWTAPARAARKPNPVPADDPSRARGRELFTAACLPCHGPLGKGDGPAAASLERKPGNLSDPRMWQQTDGAIFWKISEGNSPMPAFQEAYSEAQRWDIVNYVRTLAPKEAGEKTFVPRTSTPSTGDHP